MENMPNLSNFETKRAERGKCEACFKPLNDKDVCSNIHCVMFNVEVKQETQTNLSQEPEILDKERGKELAEEYKNFLEEIPEQENKIIEEKKPEKIPEINLQKTETQIKKDAEFIKKEIDNFLKNAGIGPKAVERLQSMDQGLKEKIIRQVTEEILNPLLSKMENQIKIIEELRKSLSPVGKEIFEKALSKTLHEIN